MENIFLVLKVLSFRLKKNKLNITFKPTKGNIRNQGSIHQAGDCLEVIHWGYSDGGQHNKGN